MKEYSMLLKWLLKVNFKSDVDSKKKKKRFALIFAFILGFAPMLAMTTIGLYSVTPQIINIGKLKEFLTMIIGVSQLVVFFFGTFSIMSYMYFSKDNEFLSSLPIQGRTIYLAKLTRVYIDELFVSAFSLLPTLTAIGVAAINNGYNLTALYFILIPFAILIMPMIPLFIISLISTPLMWIISFLKNRSALAGLASIILFMGVMGIYLGFMNSFATSQEGNNSNNIILTADMIGKITGSAKFFYIDSYFVNIMLFKNVFLNLIAFLGITISLLILSILITESLYNKASRSQLENKSVIKNKGHIENIKSQYDAILKRDLKSIVRDTGMAFNAFMGMFITPLLIAFIGQGIFKGSSEDQGFMKGYEVFFGVSFIFYYTILILCSTNYSSMIAFSREGEQFVISKYLPLDYKILIKGKVKLSNIISLLGVILTTISAIITFLISDLQLNLTTFVNLIIMAINLLIFSFAFNYLGIYRDLKKPKIYWQSVNEVVKKNNNAMISMFICMGVGFAIVIYSIALMSFKMSAKYIWFVFWPVTMIASVILLIIFKNKLLNSCEDLIDKIEC